MEYTSETGKRIVLVQGDITRIPVDAMANAANSALAGGGGVDGAIHRAGGPAIMRELDLIRAQSGGCPTGSAVATTAGNLPATYVFHAVGPVWHGGARNEPELLSSCYRACLALARERTVRTLSFPAISTGIYGYPLVEAAEIAVREAKSHLADPSTPLEKLIFVLFDARACEIYRSLL
jgi:O-acetyl-ADP-ribose deacetylase (regulator of RNase III)